MWKFFVEADQVGAGWEDGQMSNKGLVFPLPSAEGMCRVTGIAYTGWAFGRHVIAKGRKYHSTETNKREVGNWVNWSIKEGRKNSYKESRRMSCSPVKLESSTVFQKSRWIFNMVLSKLCQTAFVADTLCPFSTHTATFVSFTHAWQ